MGLDLKALDWEWYVPLFHGNRELADPMAVEIRYPSYAHILRRQERRARTDFKQGDYQKSLLVDHARRIEGLKVDGREIRTAEELWTVAVVEELMDYDLILELLGVIDSRAVLDLGKKRPSSSAPG